jgi:hypothetical protein
VNKALPAMSRGAASSNVNETLRGAERAISEEAGQASRHRCSLYDGLAS